MFIYILHLIVVGGSVGILQIFGDTSLAASAIIFYLYSRNIAIFSARKPVRITARITAWLA
jgi:hypothetical protein